MRASGEVNDHRRRAALLNSLEDQGQPRRVAPDRNCALLGVAIDFAVSTSKPATALGACTGLLALRWCCASEIVRNRYRASIPATVVFAEEAFVAFDRNRVLLHQVLETCSATCGSKIRIVRWLPSIAAVPCPLLPYSSRLCRSTPGLIVVLPHTVINSRDKPPDHRLAARIGPPQSTARSPPNAYRGRR